MLPHRGAILFSIADRDKAEALPIIKKLSLVDYRLYATEGTAAMIEREGIPVRLITKKLSEGHPNVVDVVQDGSVDAVVSTITGGGTPLRDGFYIRRAAAEKRIPCFTSLDTIRVAVETLVGGNRIFNVKPLGEYLKR
jgi:carbamoyl-phosphate synthase large subunit